MKAKKAKKKAGGKASKGGKLSKGAKPSKGGAKKGAKPGSDSQGGFGIGSVAILGVVGLAAIVGAVALSDTGSDSDTAARAAVGPAGGFRHDDEDDGTVMPPDPNDDSDESQSDEKGGKGRKGRLAKVKSKKKGPAPAPKKSPPAPKKGPAGKKGPPPPPPPPLKQGKSTQAQRIGPSFKSGTIAHKITPKAGTESDSEDDDGGDSVRIGGGAKRGGVARGPKGTEAAMATLDDDDEGSDSEEGSGSGGKSGPKLRTRLLKDCGRRVNDWSGKTARKYGDKDTKANSGQKMSITQAPWIALLYNCTGSIIDESWVVTRANCIGQDWKSSKNSKVAYAADALGEWKTADIKHCESNPDYWKTKEASSDVGLCQIDGKFQFDPEDAWLICLANDKDEPPEKGERCEIVGWNLKGTSGELRGKKVRIKSVEKDGSINYDEFLCDDNSGAAFACSRERNNKERHVLFGVHTGLCDKEQSTASSIKNNMKWITKVTGIS